MKKILVVTFALCMAFSSSTLFAGSQNIGIGFGGFLLSGKSGKLFDILGATLNGCSGSQTFAISTGTLGYKEGAVIGVNIVDVYVAENMDSLANDIAKGDGEYVDTLAHLMKIQDKVSFKDKLHKNFNRIYTSKDVTSKEVVASIKEINS